MPSPVWLPGSRCQGPVAVMTALSQAQCRAASTVPHISSFPFSSTSAMSLLYECVNTVIAGENWYLVLEWVLRRVGEGTGPGGGACDRPVPDGRPQAPPVW